MKKIKLSLLYIINILILSIFVFLTSGCTATRQEETTTSNLKKELHSTITEESTEYQMVTHENSSENSIYKDRAKLSLSPYTLSKEPIKLFLNMSMSSLVEAYGEPLAKFYDGGSYVFEYLDFYCYFDGPTYSDVEMMNQDEMYAYAFQFKLTYSLFNLTYGQAKSEIDYDEDTNLINVTPFKIQLIWNSQNLLTGIIVSEDFIE